MNLLELSEQLGKQLQAHQYFLSIAESCTGGMLSETITAIAGSSKWFDRGFITYSNQSKHELLSVPNETIEQFGAVSEETAIAMAQGVLKHSSTQFSISITGIAGPEGGTPEKPVGTVWIAWAEEQKKIIAKLFHLSGNRETIRKLAVLEALKGACEILK